MRIVRYRTGDDTRPRTGLLVGDRVSRLAVDSMAQLLGVPRAGLRSVLADATVDGPVDQATLLAPVDGRTEVWAAGVTYQRSRAARAEESRHAHAYDQVYDAVRPELFFKAPAWRVVTDGEPVRIRQDSTVDVPEPELALVVNSHGEIVGYGVCNDVSSRSIEGENPLYLPQAKIYDGSCALSSGWVPLWTVADPYALDISAWISRDGVAVWSGRTSTARLHRRLDELVRYLVRQTSFPDGCWLSTGTGIVPDLEFTLRDGDVVHIEIAGVGSLTNPVVSRCT